MGCIDDIIAKQKELAEELELAKQQERDAVLKDIKEKIKCSTSRLATLRECLRVV